MSVLLYIFPLYCQTKNPYKQHLIFTVWHFALPAPVQIEDADWVHMADYVIKSLSTAIQGRRANILLNWVVHNCSLRLQSSYSGKSFRFQHNDMFCIWLAFWYIRKNTKVVHRSCRGFLLQAYKTIPFIGARNRNGLPQASFGVLNSDTEDASLTLAEQG